MKIQRSKEVERQLKKLARKHYPIKALKPCIAAIIKQDPKVLKRIKDHALKENWSEYREFHPSRVSNYSSYLDNWIVVYKIDKDKLILALVATGKHDILHH